MGNKSRQKRERRESPESVAFRRHLRDEYDEALRAQLDGVDVAALSGISRLVAPIVEGDRVMPLIEPRARVEAHEDFDRPVCAAGLREFFRRRLPSDWPPGAKAGPYVRVREVEPGFRIRTETSIAFPSP